MLDFVEKFPPALLAYENPDEITQPSKAKHFVAPWFTNADQLVNDLAARHYEVQTSSSQSPLYGLPATRLRFLAVAFYSGQDSAIDFHRRSIDRTLTTFTMYLDLCQRKAECLTNYIYPDEHPRVVEYYDELMAAKEKEESKPANKEERRESAHVVP